jgi:hypothetical protein
MTKFDTYYTQITETNNVTPQPNTNTSSTQPVQSAQQNNAQATNQQNNTQASNQQNQTAPKPTPTIQSASQTVKPDINKLIKDFNDNKVVLQTPKDLEKYGIQIK